jgi:hypothetical protein
LKTIVVSVAALALQAKLTNAEYTAKCVGALEASFMPAPEPRQWEAVEEGRGRL